MRPAARGNFRIRSIKPEFLADARVKRWPDSVRVLFLGLISWADDHGRFTWEIAGISAFVWPGELEEDPAATFDKVRSGMKRLLDEGRIAPYEAGPERYGVLVTWFRHQHITNPSRPRYPEPPPGIQLAPDMPERDPGPPRRGPGRPRKVPIDPSAPPPPKRGRGRPRKGTPAATETLSDAEPAGEPDEAGNKYEENKSGNSGNSRGNYADDFSEVGIFGGDIPDFSASPSDDDTSPELLTIRERDRLAKIIDENRLNRVGPPDQGSRIKDLATATNPQSPFEITTPRADLSTVRVGGVEGRGKNGTGPASRKRPEAADPPLVAPLPPQTETGQDGQERFTLFGLKLLLMPRFSDSAFHGPAMHRWLARVCVEYTAEDWRGALADEQLAKVDAPRGMEWLIKRRETEGRKKAANREATRFTLRAHQRSHTKHSFAMDPEQVLATLDDLAQAGERVPSHLKGMMRDALERAGLPVPSELELQPKEPTA